jgi:thymidylate synthase (FAD)
MKVELIDHMGSDLSVVNAARVSFDKESEWVCPNDPIHTIETHGSVYCEDCDSDELDWKLLERDAKLIRYLAKHNHWTPFGHCYATFRIKAPIFVARQLGKHQVGLVWNEVSRRYVDSEPEFFTPDVWRKRADNVKQGSSDEAVTKVAIRRIDGCDNTYPIAAVYEDIRAEALRKYRSFIASGVCPEQARMVLPQSMMTEWWWSGSIAAFARVCKLRLDPHTQKETQEIAQSISDKLAAVFPVSWEALSCS